MGKQSFKLFIGSHTKSPKYSWECIFWKNCAQISTFSPAKVRFYFSTYFVKFPHIDAHSDLKHCNIGNCSARFPFELFLSSSFFMVWGHLYHDCQERKYAISWNNHIECFALVVDLSVPKWRDNLVISVLSPGLASVRLFTWCNKAQCLQRILCFCAVTIPLAVCLFRAEMPIGILILMEESEYWLLIFTSVCPSNFLYNTPKQTRAETRLPTLPF